MKVYVMLVGAFLHMWHTSNDVQAQSIDHALYLPRRVSTRLNSSSSKHTIHLKKHTYSHIEGIGNVYIPVYAYVGMRINA